MVSVIDKLLDIEKQIDEFSEKITLYVDKSPAHLKRRFRSLPKIIYGITLAFFVPVSISYFEEAYKIWEYDFQLAVQSAIIGIVIGSITLTLISLTTSYMYIKRKSITQKSNTSKIISEVTKILVNTYVGVKEAMNTQEEEHILVLKGIQELHQQQLQDAYSILTDNIIAFSDQMNKFIQTVGEQSNITIEQPIPDVYIQKNDSSTEIKQMHFFKRKNDNRELPEIK